MHHLPTCPKRCVNPAHLELLSKIEHAKVHGALAQRGFGHRNFKIGPDEVVGIRAAYAAGGLTQTEVGKLYGISQCHVSEIVRRVQWAHVP